MRYLFLLFVSLVVTNSFAQIDIDLDPIEVDSLNVEEVPFLNWENSFKSALKKSKKEKKPVLIYFTGSDWCGPCKVLDKKLFHTEKFKGLADKDLILYEADLPRNTDLLAPDKLQVNSDLKRKYKVKSFPTLVMVNHKGRIIGYKKGLILTEYYYPFLQAVIENY
ncbi:thioredoxin family protein [Polaribacter batillariae]|uniref:Thioredoxin family protein n=1 Tax=Polaribacter batillariae TaxID=2808900 RepID=A0ABX7STM9_9FLAO|nr:thioredoxin family protein [Polaribacter batillariae]QTD37526.1 thioredoxin family protein [Polaribacter batillariae]